MITELPSETEVLDVETEAIDDIPLLLGIIQEMGIQELIDGTVEADLHWQGISIGTAVSIWLCYLLSTQDHRLVAVREWAKSHRELFARMLGSALRDTDCSDDRLANILSRLGEPSAQVRLDDALMKRWMTIYTLPCDTIRLDGTSVSVYHQRDTEADTLLKFGFNHLQREGVRQFKVMMATLDPLGMPLWASVASGEQGDDLLYIPSYERAVSLLGSRALLVVGDSKMSSLSTRGQLARSGSLYLCPLNENTLDGEERLGDLNDILKHGESWQEVYRQDEQGHNVELIAVLVERERSQCWEPEDGAVGCWWERLVFVRSVALQESRIRHAERRWQHLQVALDKLHHPSPHGAHVYSSAEALDKKVEALLKESGLADIVQVEIAQQPRPHGQSRWIVDCYSRDEDLWKAYCERLGWRTYATNATAKEVEAPALVGIYRHQVLHERTFSRLKTRRLNIQPLFLRDEQRIVGLVWLLELALRILTLTEFRVRQALLEHQETIVGLNPAAPSQATAHPTTDRILAAFSHINLTIIRFAARTIRYITPLNATQQQILTLLGLSSGLYTHLELSPP